MKTQDINESPGSHRDMRILKEEKWLLTAVVLFRIKVRAGQYWVSMVYVDSNDPFRFIVRVIDHYPSRQKAERFASIFQRGIRRDPRGTYKIDVDAFRICSN